MPVSVIIPTYNRAEVLGKTLSAYSSQTGDHQILELVVIDDGSRDNTRSVVEDCARISRAPIRYLRQENRGLAAARNHGIRTACGEILLFGDDDIIPSSGLVAEHIAWHNRYPEGEVGILGYVTWAVEMHPTPFMMWSGHYGPQFQFGNFKPGKAVEFWHAYFCNSSVKAAFLKQHGAFNEAFVQYGWEDVEMSYRLYQKGFRMLYNPDAVGYHYKFESFDDTLRRVGKANESMALFATTDAGRCLMDRMHARHEPPPARPLKAVAKRVLRPFRKGVMPLVRRLADTRIPLPSRLYSEVFYYYEKQTRLGS